MAQSSRASAMRWRKPASDRFAVFQAVRLSMLRTFCGTEDTSPKSNLAKGKKLSRQASRSGLRGRDKRGYAIVKARGLDPCLELQANDVTRATACAIAVNS